MKFTISHCTILAAGILAVPVLALADPVITVTPENGTGIYHTGDKIVWDVKVVGDSTTPITEISYELKRGGATLISKDTLKLTEGGATIQTAADQPCTILADVKAEDGGPKPIEGLGGAAVDPEKITPSLPCPDDFDTFWKAKLDDLAKVPENPVLEKEDSGKPGVDYWKVELDSINGMHVYGQLARPTEGEKFPAILLMQYAGVYPFQKSWVVSRAAQGWLVLNISAHDLPIDQPQAFYDDLSKNSLKQSLERLDRN